MQRWLSAEWSSVIIFAAVRHWSCEIRDRNSATYCAVLLRKPDLSSRPIRSDRCLPSGRGRPPPIRRQGPFLDSVRRRTRSTIRTCSCHFSLAIATPPTPRLYLHAITDPGMACVQCDTDSIRHSTRSVLAGQREMGGFTARAVLNRPSAEHAPEGLELLCRLGRMAHGKSRQLPRCPRQSPPDRSEVAAAMVNARRSRPRTRAGTDDSGRAVINR
jgi:hypothetical protein